MSHCHTLDQTETLGDSPKAMRISQRAAFTYLLPGSPNVLWYLVRMTMTWKVLKNENFYRDDIVALKKVPNATFQASTSWNEKRNPLPEEGLRFWVPCGAVRDHNEKESVLGQAAPYVSTEPNAAKHFIAPCVTLLTSSIACVLLCVLLLNAGLIGTVFVEGFWIQLTNSKKRFWRRSQQPTGQKVLIAIIWLQICI